MRNVDIVEMLLDKGAKVSAVDKVCLPPDDIIIGYWLSGLLTPPSVPFQKGDTPLHIAIRGRSRRLAELLLRNPKDGRLLYRPNKAGETPYNIDCSHQKSILTQIFGARMCTDSHLHGNLAPKPDVSSPGVHRSPVAHGDGRRHAGIRPVQLCPGRHPE